ncbi:unnamed protein product, partial [Ectocarpus sp. 13 AM-2016]
MKNKVLRILGTASLALFISGSVISCSVEDGIDGINGVDGIDGEDGVNGQDGSDGQDGVNGQDGVDAIGLEKFAEYGSIDLRVQGIRPDTVAFDYQTELEFISPELNDNNFQDDDPDHEFYFLRLLDAPNIDEINGAAISLDVLDAGLASQSFSFEIEFSEFAIFADDLTYITLYDSYYGSINTNDRVSNNYGIATTFAITDYS